MHAWSRFGDLSNSYQAFFINAKTPKKMDNILFFHAIRPSVARLITKHWHDIHKPLDQLTTDQSCAYMLIDNALREILMDLAEGSLQDALKRQDNKKGGAQ